MFHFQYPDILCYLCYHISHLRTLSFFLMVAIVPAAGANLINGFHSIDTDIAGSLFNMYKTDYPQWQPYTLFHAA